jgi:hypothetical protein
MIRRIVTVLEEFCFVRAPGLRKDVFLHVSESLLTDRDEFTRDLLKVSSREFEETRESAGFSPEFYGMVFSANCRGRVWRIRRRTTARRP